MVSDLISGLVSDLVSDSESDARRLFKIDQLFIKSDYESKRDKAKSNHKYKEKQIRETDNKIQGKS